MAFLKSLWKLPLGARVGLFIILLNIAAALLAPVISPYGETDIVADVWLQPSIHHWLETDQLGRDIFTRILYGARNTISIALLTTFLSFFIGSVFGFLGATLGGWVDQLLEKGEALGLIGESGAGKSTLGLAAMSYARPGCRIVSGSIVFDGIELFGASEETLREIRGVRISYVAQSATASFNPAHRLIKQYAETPVTHGLMSFQEAKKQAVDIYRRLLLPDPEGIGYRYPHQVSGGQLQRAMVAMAMACRPDIIVFDEPATALDVTTQIEVLAAIKRITREFNTAAIYITHDLAVVAQLADRIMVLWYGNLVEEGKTREMLTNPKEEYTRELLSVRVLREERNLSGVKDDVVLQVENVSASYTGKEKVLEDIDLEIRRARTVALVGESGSGKSTLARVITGLLPPFRGRFSTKGKNYRLR